MALSSIHHSFDIMLASEYGVDEAIMIQHFQFWITTNKRLARNFHNGRTWMYESLKEMMARFPYWSQQQLERVIKKLVDLGVIIKGNFHKDPMNKTTWYAFKDENMFAISRFREMHVAESRDGGVESEKCYKDTYPDYISISDDDDDAREKTPALGCGNVHNSTLEILNIKGESVLCSTEEYFRYCVNTHKDFKPEEIQAAWKRLERYEGRIGDWKRYLDQIINNTRQEEKRCNSQTKNENNRKNAEKSTLENFKEKTLATTLKEPPSLKVTLPFQNPLRNR